MISTHSTVTARRPSVHKNLFDPSLYKVVPNPIEPSRHVKRNAAYNKGSFQARFTSLFPHHIEHYFPKVNIPITGLCLIWYVFSSMSSNLSKAILKSFRHPVALTEIQFLLSALLCLLFVTVINFLQKPVHQRRHISKMINSIPEGIIPPYLDGSFRRSVYGKFLIPCKLAIMTTFPMGIFQFIGHITSHKATSLIPVSLVHSMKALSPIVTVAYYKFFEKKDYNLMTYYTLMLLIAGVMVTCWSTHNSIDSTARSSSMVVGLIYSTASMLIFVSQNIFAKTILSVKKGRGYLSASVQEVNPNSEKLLQRQLISPYQLDKITIIFYCSVIGFLLTLPPFLTGELFQGHRVLQDISAQTLLLILVHAISHFLQAMLAFQLIGMLTSVNYSVANILKRIVIIFVALIWEARLNLMQLVGLSLTMCGLYGYDKWGGSSRTV